MKFRKSDKIQFISTIEGLESIEECLPKPAKHFIPKWFKDIPPGLGNTVKNCPSFPDFFSQGYILPMWCDVILKYDKDADFFDWKTSTNKFSWSIHDSQQFLKYKDPSFLGSDSQLVFKADSPWKIITPPGWSVLQLPLFYHFNKEWSVMPGVIDTDIHHDINQQVLYHGNGKEVLIKSGDPFVLYIPFKRSDKLDYEIRHKTDQDEKIFNRQQLRIGTKFLPNGTYRKAQRERDDRR